jgi:CubicO group peptidase (beta-lactamase class C family)
MRTVLATILTFALLSGCATLRARPTVPDAAAIDRTARALMAREQVTGMALAVIDGGQIVHVAAYGYRNAERRLPLETDTIMYGASLTKVAFAHLVLQLVDEGALALDRPLADYLPRPLPDYEGYGDLKADPRWRRLTARIVLTHATGLANMRGLEPDRRLRFHWDPGARYGYSNEGFWILQTVLEQGLGLDVGAEMRRRVFDRFGMARTAMQWRDDFAGNLADGYGIDGSFEPHDRRDNVAAAGSMDTTIADQARFWAALVRGEGLSRASRAELVRPQLAIVSASQFPTLADTRDPRGPAIGLAAGLGVITLRDGRDRLWLKGGHNDWTGNMAVCQEARRRCVVLLGNSVRAERIYPELVAFVLGATPAPWWWEYGATIAPVTP